MPKTMLIDATHAEETRVAVVDGNRLVEFDYESKVRKQLKGGIFLAKVTRVEPSLQAAFVNFGGNRHGFLPFSEIHPDYFRIPVADREALLAAQMAELEEHDVEMEQQEAAIEQRAARSESGEPAEDDHEDEEEIEAIVEVGGEDQPLDEEDEGEETAQIADAEESDEEDEAPSRPIAMENRPETIAGPVVEEDEDSHESHDHHHDDEEQDFAQPDHDHEGHDDQDSEESDEQPEDQQPILDAEGNVIERAEGSTEGQPRRDRGGRGRGRGGNRGRGKGRGRNGQGGRSHDSEQDSVESLGGDGVDGDRPFRFNFRRSYKIQEVIKRGQIMLIQVSKEERGNKGAAVTTYLSLPGRYCVLMPNSPRGGGVSRKIASFKDRKRMKDMLGDLAVPDGMSVILRTAGVARTKVEIKRDLDYLTRLWNTIREHTLKSSAPAMIYEEGSLIKRAIRDLYSRDIDDVFVSGDDGYKAAKEFMKMLMPSHAKKVQEYKNDRIPMFHKYGVEAQIADIGEPNVNLKSGGYLVINPTEALVSVDVNSGRATKERHIEETAVKTNLEAADEVARQLRLRDLGGLVVIDFIDMEDRRNNRKVEQRLRDALSTDRARIQVGRISSFGLLELSRQRLNPSLSEAQTEICQHCAGIGRVRTLDFSAISILRAVEAEGVKAKCTDVILTMGLNVALYILNNKRQLLNDIEGRYGFTVHIETDNLMSNTHYTLETETRDRAPKVPEGITVATPSASDDSYDESEEEIDDEEGGEESSNAQPSQREPREPRPPRNRDDEAPELDSEGRPKRRRGRRGGRGRGRRDNPDGTAAPQGTGEQPEFSTEQQPSSNDDGDRQPDSHEGNPVGGEDRPRRDRNRGRRGGRDRGERRPRTDVDGNVASPVEQSERVAPVLSAPETFIRQPAPASNDAKPLAAPAPREYETVNEAPDKKKKGWWNKLVE